MVKTFFGGGEHRSIRYFSLVLENPATPGVWHAITGAEGGIYGKST